MSKRKGSPDRISLEIRRVIKVLGGLKKTKEKTGISVRQLSFYQTGRDKPGSEAIEKLARAGGVTADQILGLTENLGKRDEIEPYGNLGEKERTVLDEVKELLEEADDDIKRHLRNQIRLLRRAVKTPKKRASGEG